MPGEVDVPDISFDLKMVDLGHISRNKMVECAFPFKNLGKKTLVIHDIETTCSCFNGEATMKEVPPGGSAAIVAKFEPYKFGGRDYIKSLRVSTNDPDEPIISLGIRTEIMDEAVLEPDTLLFPNVQSGQPAYAEVKLIQEGKQDLLIKKITSSSPSISVTAAPRDEENKAYLLTVEIAPDMPEGQFDETVTIFTNYKDFSAGRAQDENVLKDYSKLKLSVKGSVAGMISVVPQTLNFGSVAAHGDPIRRKIYLSSSTIDFEVKSISIANSSFRVSYSPVEPGKKYEVSVEYIPGQAEGQIEAELVIATTGPTLNIPVFISIKPSS